MNVADCSKPGLAVSASSVTSKDGEGSVTLALTRASSGAAFDPATFSVMAFTAASRCRPISPSASTPSRRHRDHRCSTICRRGRTRSPSRRSRHQRRRWPTAPSRRLWVEDERLRSPRYHHLPDHDRPLRQREGAGGQHRRLRPAAQAADLDGVKAPPSTKECSARSGVNTLVALAALPEPDRHLRRQRRPPVQQSYHGYWPSQPRTIEDLYGGEEALDAVDQRRACARLCASSSTWCRTTSTRSIPTRRST